MMVKRVPIDTYCEKKIPTLQKTYDGLIDYVDISSVDNAEKKIISYQTIDANDAPSRAKQLLKQGDVLVSTVRPNLNAVAVVEEETENLMVGSTGYCVLRCKETMDVRYLFNFCQSQYFVDDMSSQATGASYPAVSNGIVRSSLIPCYSIEEQKEIAKKMDTVSELLALRKQQLAELDELTKSRFIELFDACNCRISTFGKEFSFISRGKSPSYVELSDLAVINQACIYWNGLNFDKVKYNDVSYSGDRILQFGDVLVNSTGTGTLGRANIFMRRSADKRYMADSHVTIIRGSVSCHPVYIKCYLEQAKIQDAIYRNCVSGSTNQIELSKEKFKELELPVPPMTLQQQFAAFVEQTDKSKLAIQQSLEKLETLKKSLMQKYFG